MSNAAKALDERLNKVLGLPSAEALAKARADRAEAEGVTEHVAQRAHDTVAAELASLLKSVDSVEAENKVAIVLGGLSDRLHKAMNEGPSAVRHLVACLRERAVERFVVPPAS